jgi:hypothetical protein
VQGEGMRQCSEENRIPAARGSNTKSVNFFGHNILSHH